MYAFANLDHVTGFWLRDYSQNILPMSFREGMKTYFGKKGMSMHVDVFFTRSMSEELEKRVYLSMIYRCDQNKIDTMNIAAHVTSEFSKDYPNVVKLFLKSDNAGCYHGKNILEPLYNLCKNSNIKLLRCDFNEPCKGKDQCDRESAGAKRVINSYLESGQDVMTADDVYEALHHGSGLRNSQVCVLEVNSDESSLSGPTIKGINSYHSAVFYDDHYALYRYYNIGGGKTVKYSDSTFLENYEVKKIFHNTSDRKQKMKKKKVSGK